MLKRDLHKATKVLNVSTTAELSISVVLSTTAELFNSSDVITQ